MQLSENVVIREMAGVTVLLPLDGSFQGIRAVNPVGARILELLREGICEEEKLLSILCDEYAAPAEEITADARAFLAELWENHILK